MSSDHKIKVGNVFKDLDEIFKLRTKPKRGNVSFGKGNDDLSNKYEKSESSADQITYDTNFKINGTDFRYLFKDKNFVDVVIPTHDIASVGNSVSEGSAITFNVVTTNVANGTQFTWAASRNDLSPKSGTVTIQNNKATFNVTAIADSTTEGNQTFKIDLKSTSAGTPTVATSNDVTIVDTSLTPAPVIGIKHKSTFVFGFYSDEASGEGEVSSYTCVELIGNTAGPQYQYYFVGRTYAASRRPQYKNWFYDAFTYNTYNRLNNRCGGGWYPTNGKWFLLDQELSVDHDELNYIHVKNTTTGATQDIPIGIKIIRNYNSWSVTSNAATIVPGTRAPAILKTYNMRGCQYGPVFQEHVDIEIDLNITI